MSVLTRATWCNVSEDGIQYNFLYVKSMAFWGLTLCTVEGTGFICLFRIKYTPSEKPAEAGNRLSVVPHCSKTPGTRQSSSFELKV
jgi:hypothetical protein